MAGSSLNTKNTKIIEDIVEELKKLKDQPNTGKESRKETTADLNEKIKYLKLLFKQKRENVSAHATSFNTFNQPLDSLIMSMPSELVDLINDEINFCLESGCSPETLNRRVQNKLYLLELAYKDSRKYLDIYSRNYQELLLADFISEICDTEYTEEDWHRIARVNFELYGLKAVNEFGVDGKSSGNDLLQVFADILKNGKTARALEQIGVRVIPSAEKSDEFSWLLYAPFDIRPLLPTIEELLLEEFDNEDVKEIIDLNNEKMGIIVQNKQERCFKIVANVGSATLGEILQNLSLPEDTPYVEIGRMIMNRMFRVADMRSQEHREKVKEKLKNENKPLYMLFSRTDGSMLEERVRELEEEVESLKKDK